MKKNSIKYWIAFVAFAIVLSNSSMADPTMTVSVGTQSGTLTEGVAGSATYEITLGYSGFQSFSSFTITLSQTSYSPSVPAGVTTDWVGTLACNNCSSITGNNPYSGSFFWPPDGDMTGVSLQLNTSESSPGGTYTFKVQLNLDYIFFGSHFNADFFSEDITLEIASSGSNPTAGGTIAADQTICYGTAPAAFTSESLPTGHTGTLEYQWQLNTSTPTVNWEDVGSVTTTATYDHIGTLTQTTWFRRLARVGCMSDWAGAAVSNELQVTVEKPVYYMTKNNGSWHTLGIWFTNTIGGTNPDDYTTPATVLPTAENSAGIFINNEVYISQPEGSVTVDQMTILAGAALTVQNSNTLTVANGPGTDLTVNGVLSIAMEDMEAHISAGYLSFADGAKAIINSSASNVALRNTTFFGQANVEVAGTPIYIEIIEKGISTFNFNREGDQVIHVLGGDFYDVEINNTGTKTLQNGATIKNDLTIANGSTLELNNGRYLYLEGVFTNNGTFTGKNNSTVHYQKSGNQSVAVGAYHHLTISGTGDKTQGGNLSVAGNLTISDCATYRTGTQAYTLTITGNLVALGTGAFSAAGDNTVVLNGGNQEISVSRPSITFINLTKEVSATSTLTLPAGKELIIDGTITLKGAENAYLLLRSSEDGVQWKIDMDAAKGGDRYDFAWLDVKDSKNEGITTFDVKGKNCLNSGNNIGWLFDPATIYVDASQPDDNANGFSWANAKKTLQAALDMAESGGQIWVAAGTYTPAKEVGGEGDRFKTFQMKNGVAIYGGFAGTETNINQRTDYGIGGANETILSGDLNGNGLDHNDSYHVFYHPSGLGLTHSAILDGFTIKGGVANGTIDHSTGGGIFCDNNSPTLRNLIITGNHSQGSGAAMRLNNNSNAVLTNVLIFGNNSLNTGGGLYIAGSNVTANNVTIAKNNASNEGGGLDVNSGTSDFNNSIIHGNTTNWQAYQIHIGHGATLNLRYSCYSDLTKDVINNGIFNLDINCITSDPLFVDHNNGDFRIHGTSPCVDAGDDSYNDLLTDIRGFGFGRKLDKDDHTQTGTIDMGAYEYKQGTDPFSPCANPTASGTITTTLTTICYDTSPAVFTSTTEPSGHTGDLEYLWQMNTISATASFELWEELGVFTETATYDHLGTLTQTTWFRRLARVECDPVGWASATASNVVVVTVYNHLVAGTATGTQTICHGGTPTALQAVAPTGGSGDYAYQWQQHNGAAWVPVTGGTGSSTLTYNPPALTQTTAYRLAQTDNFCNPAQTVYTGTVTVTVHAQLVAGTASGTQTICYNGTPAALQAAAPTGGSEPANFTYQWEQLNGTEWVAAIGGTGSSTLNYQPPALTETTAYRLAQTDTFCGSNPTTVVHTGTVTVMVHAQLVAGTVTGTQTICYGAAPAALQAAAPAGGSTQFEYEWQQWNGAGWVAAAGGTGSSTLIYQPPPLTQQTSYRLKQTDTFCGDNPTSVVHTGTVTVTLEPTPSSGSLAKNPDVAAVIMGATVSATLTAGDGGKGEDALQYRTHDGTKWSDWEDYTSEASISSFRKTKIQIQTWREADYCQPAGIVSVSWDVETTSVTNLDEGFVYYFIQDAVDVASPGHTICIGTNTYNEDVDTSGRGGLILQAGCSLGTVTITGTLTLTADDELQIELFGDVDYDKFIIGTNAAINGASLDIKVVGTYKPVAGTRFTIFTSPNNPGKFTSPSLIKTNGHHFILSYEENDGKWNVVLTTVVKMFKLEIRYVGDR